MIKTQPTLKGLIFDIDGTAFPSGKDAYLTRRVVSAVRRAKKEVFVSIATGRNLTYAEKLLKTFGIDQPVILCGGTQIYNPTDGATLWEGALKPQTVHQIFHLLAPFPHIQIYTDDDNFDFEKNIHSEHPQKISIIYLIAVSETDKNKILDALKDIEGISVPVFRAWVPGKWDIHIVDELATKKHALAVLLAYKKLQHEEVMIVGDGNNDLPLFDLSGWRVAMGNAVEPLKKAADWIAPTVEEDGLAVAIEKFILKTND